MQEDDDSVPVIGSEETSVVGSELFFSAKENAGSSSITSLVSARDIAPSSGSPTSRSMLTVSSGGTYEIPPDTPTLLHDNADSTTDVESFVSAREDTPTATSANSDVAVETSSSVDDDDDVETFAANEEMGESSFDTDATQVSQSSMLHQHSSRNAFKYSFFPLERYDIA